MTPKQYFDFCQHLYALLEYSSDILRSDNMPNGYCYLDIHDDDLSFELWAFTAVPLSFGSIDEYIIDLSDGTYMGVSHIVDDKAGTDEYRFFGDEPAEHTIMAIKLKFT